MQNKKMSKFSERDVEELFHLLRKIDGRLPPDEFLSLGAFKERLWTAHAETKSEGVKAIIAWVAARAQLPSTTEGRVSAVAWLTDESRRSEIDYDFILDHFRDGSTHLTCAERRVTSVLMFCAAGVMLLGAFALSAISDWSSRVSLASIGSVVVLFFATGVFVLRGLIEVIWNVTDPGPTRQSLSPAPK